MQIVFNVLVGAAFVAQVANYWLIGRGIVNRYLFLFVLGCFFVTETMLALSFPSMWLYVALNGWGIINLYKKDPR
jgi:hypothetical protein